MLSGPAKGASAASLGLSSWSGWATSYALFLVTWSVLAGSFCCRVTGVAKLWSLCCIALRLVCLICAMAYPSRESQELRRCSWLQLIAIAAWLQEAAATEGDPLLVLFDRPQDAATVTEPLPAGLGPNASQLVRDALREAGGVPSAFCPNTCVAFKNTGRMLAAHTAVRNRYPQVFSISAAIAALTNTAPRPTRIFDSLVVMALSDVVCGDRQFFDIAYEA